MIDMVSTDSCTGCGACVDVCPKHCITMREDDEGFRMPSLDKSQCIECGQCTKVCPTLHLEPTGNVPQHAYAAWHKDRNVYMDSSSGGAFTALAENIIADGGIVFGAVYDESRKVWHCGIDTVEDIAKLRRAKYIQSNTMNIFRQVKQEASTGRPLLFVGTPCQAAAMYQFFTSKPSNLIIVEFICHGISSWKFYQLSNTNLEKKYVSKLSKMDFHSKMKSWRSNTVRAEFSNGTARELSSFENPYMYGFFKNITLRKSCYHCLFKKENRHSDIIIADFWEIRKVAPELDKRDGVSMLLSLTDTGDRLIHQAENRMEVHEVDCTATVSCKKHMSGCDYDMQLRTEFMNAVKERGYDWAEKKYLKPAAYLIPIKLLKDYVLIKLGRR